jgi:hypothetical protein
MHERPPRSTPASARVEIDGGAVSIDAAIVGRGLGLEPREVLRLMREGVITGICEQGVDDDAGRHRLTFFHKGRRLQLIVGSSGEVVHHSSIDFGDRPLPARLHRPER